MRAKEEEKKEEERGQVDQKWSQGQREPREGEPREPAAEMTGLYRKERLQEGV